MTQLQVLARLLLKRQEKDGILNAAGRLLVGKCIMSLMADCKQEESR